MSTIDTLMIVQSTPEMTRHWGWFLAFGILVAALGVAAIVRSFASTIASMMFFGWMLVLAGIFELIESFMVGHWAGFFLHSLAALLFLVTGVLFLSRPLIERGSGNVRNVAGVSVCRLV